MKHAFRFVLAIALTLPFFRLPAFAFAPGELFAETAVLLEGETGQVLFGKDKDKRVYPASTTKIMTAILVLESCALDEVVTVRESALAIDEWDSANIGLSAGEEITVDDALYALMLPSANDMANALAEHVAGTQEDFAARMNETAKGLGADNTHFTNAHGLPDPEHYTTAYDMALITRYAMQNEHFARYFSADEHTIPPTNRQPIPRQLRNYQEMLLPNSAFYDPSVTGGKVGYTGQARHTMSTVAEKYGRTLVAVVMGSGRSEKFYDTAALLRHGFEDFQPASLPESFFEPRGIPILEDGVPNGEVEVFAEEAFPFLLENSLSLVDVYADYRLPASAEPDGAVEAYADVMAGGVLLGTVELGHRVVPGSRLPSWITHPAEGRNSDGANLSFAIVLLAASGAVLLARVIVLLRRRGKRKKEQVAVTRAANR